ncbi:MAG: hypothetical protein RQ982_00670 [Gammaproteobacteria bacterium]|nr:hypothetical protein [Gammaproteobacteria bacterium]
MAVAALPRQWCESEQRLLFILSKTLKMILAKAQRRRENQRKFFVILYIHWKRLKDFCPQMNADKTRYQSFVGRALPAVLFVHMLYSVGPAHPAL